MAFNVVIGVIVGFLCVAVAYLWRETGKLKTQLIHAALKVSEIADRVDRVDDSTGKAIYELSQKFETFNTLYGEAAIEEKREAAKAEKAWSEGISNIMSFGSQFQGRGGKE